MDVVEEGREIEGTNTRHGWHWKRTKGDAEEGEVRTRQGMYVDAMEKGWNRTLGWLDRTQIAKISSGSISCDEEASNPPHHPMLWHKT